MSNDHTSVPGFPEGMDQAMALIASSTWEDTPPDDPYPGDFTSEPAPLFPEDAALDRRARLVRYRQPPVNTNWFVLSADEKQRTLRALFPFVQQIVETFHISRSAIPPYWYEADALIIEMLALQELHAYSTGTDMPGLRAMSDWLTTLEYSLRRCTDFVARWRANTADPAVDPQLWAVENHDAAKEVAESFQSWLESRGEDW